MLFYRDLIHKISCINLPPRLIRAQKQV